MKINIGKLIVLIFCCLTFIPLMILILGAIGHIGEGYKFETSTLGKLCDIN